MTKNQLRYRICLQCVEEESGGFYKTRVLEFLRHVADTRKRWINPWSIDSKYTHGKLCGHCPYELEHLVIRKSKDE